MLSRKSKKRKKKQDSGEARNGSGYSSDDWTDGQPFPISRFAAALWAVYTDATISWTVKRKSKRAGVKATRRLFGNGHTAFAKHGADQRIHRSRSPVERSMRGCAAGEDICRNSELQATGSGTIR